MTPLGHWNVAMFELKLPRFGQATGSLPEGWEPFEFVERHGRSVYVLARQFVPVPPDSPGDALASVGMGG